VVCGAVFYLADKSCDEYIPNNISVGLACFRVTVLRLVSVK
jgi:hypothetical protein